MHRKRRTKVPGNKVQNIPENHSHTSRVPTENSSPAFHKFVKQKRKKIKKYIKDMRKKPTFDGWGMTTMHALPWNDMQASNIFFEAARDVKRFEFVKLAGINANTVDQLLWRHWIISFSIRYILEFTDEKEINAVECGVAYGLSAFFVLRELQDALKSNKIDQYRMHLYDAWVSTKKYGEISMDLTQRNLKEFAENVAYHKGYVPESFSTPPGPPEKLMFLHIDLNSASATLAALDFYYPKLGQRGVILFDDYGHLKYVDTKKVADGFFADKDGILMPLPTGQAIFFR
jgi:hypothetical protein